MFYVYIIIDPRDNSPIYVGKGKGYRINHHWNYMLNHDNPGINPKLYNKLTNIFTAGYRNPTYKKVFKTDNELLAYAMEVFWIAIIGLENLCNLTTGGDNPPSQKGSKITEKTRKKLSDSHKKFNSNPEIRERKRQIMIDRYSDPREREKQGNRLKEYAKSHPNSIVNGELARLSWSAECRDKHVEAIKKGWRIRKEKESALLCRQ